MGKRKVLVIGSNATEIEVHGGTGKTGQYLNETVVPIWILKAAGYEIVLATPDGTKPHIDAASGSAVHFGGDHARCARAKAFFNDNPSMNDVRTLHDIVEEGLQDYVGVFVPGGEAPIVDFMQDNFGGSYSANTRGYEHYAANAKDFESLSDSST